MDFIKDGELERGVDIRPGHEYLVVGKQNYGTADDRWNFVVRNGQCVAGLSVFTKVLNGRLLSTPAQEGEAHERIWGDYERATGAKQHLVALLGDLSFCTSFPTEVDSIRAASRGNDCLWQRGGRHYSFGEPTVSGADPMVRPLDDLFMSGPPRWWTERHDEVKRHLSEQAEVWQQLTAWFQENEAAARVAHAALPHRCTFCDGTGVVPKGTRLPG